MKTHNQVPRRVVLDDTFLVIVQKEIDSREYALLHKPLRREMQKLVTTRRRDDSGAGNLINATVVDVLEAEISYLGKYR